MDYPSFLSGKGLRTSTTTTVYTYQSSSIAGNILAFAGPIIAISMITLCCLGICCRHFCSCCKVKPRPVTIERPRPMVPRITPTEPRRQREQDISRTRRQPSATERAGEALSRYPRQSGARNASSLTPVFTISRSDFGDQSAITSSAGALNNGFQPPPSYQEVITTVHEEDDTRPHAYVEVIDVPSRRVRSVHDTISQREPTVTSRHSSSVHTDRRRVSSAGGRPTALTRIFAVSGREPLDLAAAGDRSVSHNGGFLNDGDNLPPPYTPTDNSLPSYEAAVCSGQDEQLQQQQQQQLRQQNRPPQRPLT